ncbi:hypothetical protein FB566_2073 [Stackebrandtia endophytica]|uniref:SH3 domain-containing protein n=1 Tax=Stackebrandtia endophytica TaxID=1496996 RepID=A0A543AVH3_9ACTN|nr:hypothetical protein [Stackebrandtia endophytica]TQL76541.1 hypothetical protein FB566_2073 [Stackebrandtia endophytica]
MKRTMIMRSAVAAAAAAGLVLAASSPAHAAADPALVNCSFAGLYDSYDASGGTGLQGYTKRDDSLTVTAGNGHAWEVTVNDGFMSGKSGWIESDCVIFLA